MNQDLRSSGLRQELSPQPGSWACWLLFRFWTQVERVEAFRGYFQKSVLLPVFLEKLRKLIAGRYLLNENKTRKQNPRRNA